MATELGGSVFEITHDLIGDLFRAKNAGVTPSHLGEETQQIFLTLLRTCSFT
jgi:hypothetical protein